MNRIQKLIHNTTLRRIRKYDIDFYNELHEDEYNCRMLGTTMPWSEVTTSKWFDSETDSSDELLLIVEYENIPIGLINIFNLSMTNRNCCMSIRLKPQYIGLGIGQIACYKVLELCFDNLNVHKVKTSYYEYNKLSGRTQEKSGLIRQGIEKEEKFLDGRYWDRIIMATFRPQFEVLKERYKSYQKGGVY